MRSVPLWKWMVILASGLISLYYLYPSVVWYRLDPEIRNEANPQTPEIKAIDEQIAEIRSATDTASLDRIAELEDQRQQLRDHLFGLRNAAVPLGLDLAGGMHVVLEVEGASETEEAEAAASVGGTQQGLLDQALTVYRARIDKLGLTEPVVEKQPPNRILIQIPGVKNPEDVLKILRATARLEFHLASPDDVLVRTWDAVVRAMPTVGERVTVTPPVIQVAERDIESVSRALDLARLDVPPGFRFYWGPFETSKSDRTKKFRNLYLLDEKIEMGGDTLTRANVDFQNQFVAQPVVSLQFNKEGTALFARITSDHVNDNLAIVLDETVYSAPNINEPIRGGQAIIQGSFTTAEAQNLAVVLEAGALKTNVRIIENRSIGPSLGRDSIRQGLNACLYGFIAILVFMPCYYFLSGMFANVALFLNLLRCPARWRCSMPL